MPSNSAVNFSRPRKVETGVGWAYFEAGSAEYKGWEVWQMSSVLNQLLEELTTGSLRIADLTHPLSAQTPLLPLPPQFNNTPAFRMWELSHYDERGPAWYWNAFETGEHTGTHFDAPVHWISG